MRKVEKQFPPLCLNNSSVDWKHIYSEERMKRLILVVVLLTLTALMVACGGGAVEAPVQEAAPTEAVVEETAPTEKPFSWSRWAMVVKGTPVASTLIAPL